jgi:N-formylmaleamate deformylase
LRVGIPLINGIVSRETAEELQNLNPRLRFEQIEDAGHGVPYDQPERFEEVVTSFLR